MKEGAEVERGEERAPPVNKTDFLTILHVLREHEVDFIVVGGVGAVLHGAPVSTFDLDVVYSAGESTVSRLLLALERLDARYRVQPERQMRPETSHLAAGGHQLLMTRWGPLDLRGSVGRSRRYEELLPKTVEMDLGQGIKVAVLDLKTMIAVKEEAGGAQFDERDHRSGPNVHYVTAERRQAGCVEDCAALGTLRENRSA
jgi:hypothetical protein